MPQAALGGRKEIMAKLAPLGPVYQAGTLSGNPLAVAAGLATLQLIRTPEFFANLKQTTTALIEGLIALAQEAQIAFSAQSVGGMFGFYFAKQCPTNYHEAIHTNKSRFNAFFHAMLAHGIYFAPSAFEAGFISSAHSAEDIDTTLQAARKVFMTLSSIQDQ
jgi:glutamate-1-semialdehyde 2,1-aminomutase